jgi:hypothetical protein
MFLQNDQSSAPSASVLWIVLLTAASTATTFVLACATPFSALAALAAVHMRQRDGIILMLLTWLASQIVGFGFLDYPHSPSTFAWGGALAMAGVVAALGAYAALSRLEAATPPMRLAVAYGAAFVAFKAVILLWALGLGGVATTLDPAIVARQFVRNGAILVGLFLLYHGLVTLGVPAARQKFAPA